MLDDFEVIVFRAQFFVNPLLTFSPEGPNIWFSQ